MEAQILLWIQNNLRNDVLTPFMKVVTMLGNKGWFFILVSLILLCLPKTRKTGLACALSLILHLLAVNLCLKPLIFRARPYDVIPGLVNIIEKQSDASFPSGHTAAAFAVTTVLLLRADKRLSIPMLVLSVILAFSRLYVGVHYPTDVLAGVLIGVLFGVISVWIVDKIGKKKD